MADYFHQIIEEINEEDTPLKYKIGKFSNSIIKIATDQTPFFAYDYLNFDIPEYSFHHTDFLHDDYKIYFKKVNKLARLSLNDLIDNHKRTEHFHINAPNKQMVDILKTIFNKPKIRPEELPSVGQFHLYTPNDGSKKAPRIHFFIGPLAVFYIILYDPYHQIHPTKQ